MVMLLHFLTRILIPIWRLMIIHRATILALLKRIFWTPYSCSFIATKLILSFTSVMHWIYLECAPHRWPCIPNGWWNWGQINTFSRISINANIWLCGALDIFRSKHPRFPLFFYASNSRAYNDFRFTLVYACEDSYYISRTGNLEKNFFSLNLIILK